jgi:Cu(I)/Ag(I) efflux system membrane fusion protein
MPRTTTLGQVRALPEPAAVEHSPHSGQGEHGGQAAYVCPMHPEVISKEPGKCPICGMKLEPGKANP